MTLQTSREELINDCIERVFKRCEGIEIEEELDSAIQSEIPRYEEYMCVSPPFSFEERNIIANHVKAEVSVYCRDGDKLFEADYSPWYAERRPSINQRFWKRFRRFVETKIPINAVANLDATTSEILDFAGDPKEEGTFQRKGLVVGDVQSGKTNCYLGLTCKALDAGYNIIVILAGNSEPLRSQTQARVDEAVVGINSDPEKREYIGAGKNDRKYSKAERESLAITTLTTVKSDFGITKKDLNTGTAVPIVLVIKKNVHVLENVHNWLKSPQYKDADGLVNKSILVIDDESDYASINTRTEEDITQTNRLIRSILVLFSRAAYIGYTATPYANIFVDPRSYNDMVKDDLFPKDFIYSMWPPSNYIGPRQIFEDDGTHSFMVRTIPDDERILPGDYKHKKDATFDEMPPTMMKAIACFYLACTLRDLNGEGNKPMSMMIHISRFKDVQGNATDTIQEAIEALYSDIVSFYALPVDQALKHPSIKFIHDVWEEEYKELEWPQNEWQFIQSSLMESGRKIGCKIINSDNEKQLDYRKQPSMRVIVIGGNALSRGLTLEGLMVSYFYRRSKQYDTLLQMGRWFGYKDGYDVLCRIWANREVQYWFGYVGRVNEELKNSIDDMCREGKTPSQYGLRVQEDITGFTMTSRNKMKSSAVEYIVKNLAGDVRDTMYVLLDRESVLESHRALNDFYSSHSCVQREGCGNVLIRNIHYQEIVNLLRRLKISSKNEWYGFPEVAESIANFDVKQWDVAVVSKPGESASKSPYPVGDWTIYCPQRSKFDFREFGPGGVVPTLLLMGNRNLKSPGDFEEFLTKEQIDKVKARRGKQSPSAADYMVEGRNPVLLVYYIDFVDSSVTEDLRPHYDAMKQSLGELKPPGFAMGFPRVEGEDSSDKNKIKYRANVVCQRLDDYE